MSSNLAVGEAALIGRLYDAALDARLWKGVSALTADAMNATSGVVKLHASDDLVQLMDVTANFEVSGNRQGWVEHWHANDLWVERAAMAGPGQIITSQQLVSEDEQRRSGFYQEWLRELAIFHMVGTVFQAGAGRLGVFGVHRPQDAEPFTAHDRGRLATLVPHVARAFELGERLAGVDFARDLALQSLDALSTGVMIVDGHCRLIHVNKPAEEMLRTNEAIGCYAGRLLAYSPTLHARLAAAVRDAADLAGDAIRAAPKAIRLDNSKRAACTMTVLPLRPRYTAFQGHRPLALILLRDPECRSIPIDALRDLFGFTRMEALVAAELAQGHDLPRIAGDLGISIATVRTHMKQVLLKTDTSRQPEAVATILRSTACLSGLG